MDKIAEYRKFVVALAGIAIPFLNQMGVALPEFLTADWLNTLLLSLTPILVVLIPNTPAKPSSVNSPPLVGLLAGLLALLVLSGCSGTRSAYSAAEGLEETAVVIAEHYYAVVRELNDLADAGTLRGAALTSAQEVVGATRGPIFEMQSIAQAYAAVRSADNEQALSQAVTTAAIALSRLIDVLQEVRRLVTYEPERLQWRYA